MCLFCKFGVRSLWRIVFEVILGQRTQNWGYLRSIRVKIQRLLNLDKLYTNDLGSGIGFENLGSGIYLHKIRDLRSRDPRLPTPDFDSQGEAAPIADASMTLLDRMRSLNGTPTSKLDGRTACWTREDRIWRCESVLVMSPTELVEKSSMITRIAADWTRWPAKIRARGLSAIGFEIRHIFFHHLLMW